MTRQRGIALVQVLLVTGIIGLLMLQVGLTAREQVARAQALTDRAELQLAAQSRETALLFSLLTEPWVRKPESENPYAAAWNFRGDPFTVDGVSWRIQDESGLVQIPRYGTLEFESLLVRLGVEPQRARRIADQLRERQTGERASALAARSGAPQGASAFPLQAVEELAALPDVGPELFQRLGPLLTLYPTPGFNPLTAPEALLEAMLTESQAAGALEARRAGQLDELALWKLTGITPGEGTVLASGPGFTVTMGMGLRDSRTQRTTTYILRPYQMEPLAVWQRSKGEDPQEQ